MGGIFDSFWIAGYESAAHINRSGVRLDMIVATQHDIQVADDYRLLKSVGITTAREGVRWHLVDRAGAYDFSSLAPFVEAARCERIQVIWNLCHYGWPDSLDVFSGGFVERFANYAGAVAQYLRNGSSEPLCFAPVNEISFLAWAASRDIIYPYAHGRDGEIKSQLVRAAIAGCDAIRSVDPRARFVFADPVYHVFPPRAMPELAPLARGQEDAQYEAWDMLGGYLDIVGVNFYHANQWEYPDMRLRWEDTPRDKRWVPFHKLLLRVYQRYHRPIFIAETSHFGVGRGPWLREMAREIRIAKDNGVPVEGVCIYPVIDRPDWENPHHWHNSGLWDLVPDSNGSLRRIISSAYAEELKRAQLLLP